MKALNQIWGGGGSPFEIGLCGRAQLRDCEAVVIPEVVRA